MNRKQPGTRRALAVACAALVSVGASACATAMQGSGSGSAGAEAHASMTAVHTAEIQEGQLALSRSTNAQVRAFAQHMVTDHRPFLQEEQQLAARLGLGAQVGAGAQGGAGVQGAAMGADLGVSANTSALMMSFPTSRMLVDQHMRAMADLQDESGMELDREYMDRQIAAHRQALELATRFETSVQDPQQRALIARERAAVQMHLQHAQQVRAALQ